MQMFGVGVTAVIAALAAGGAAGRGGDSRGTSLWAPSQHAVFQQMALQASAAMEHFLAQQQQQAGSPLELLLLYLATCSDVFSRPGGPQQLAGLVGAGGAGGSLLLPALHRPWQQLGWQELWRAALDPQLRQAPPRPS